MVRRSPGSSPYSLERPVKRRRVEAPLSSEARTEFWAVRPDGKAPQASVIPIDPWITSTLAGQPTESGLLDETRGMGLDGSSPISLASTLPLAYDVHLTRGAIACVVKHTIAGRLCCLFMLSQEANMKEAK